MSQEYDVSLDLINQMYFERSTSFVKRRSPKLRERSLGFVAILVLGDLEEHVVNEIVPDGHNGTLALSTLLVTAKSKTEDEKTGERQQGERGTKTNRWRYLTSVPKT